jgi:hypothetical protein
MDDVWSNLTKGKAMTTYKLELLPDSSHQWRLLELRPRKGTRGGLRYVCIAIGTGKTNMERLETELTMKPLKPTLFARQRKPK